MINSSLLGLDVGTVRTGVAIARPGVKLAVGLTTLAMSDEADFIEAVQKLASEHQTDTLIVGYPRNQQGEATRQTQLVERYGELLQATGLTVIYQDESLTSVLAEQRLSTQRKSYTKEAVDAEAASIILQDYIDTHGK